MENEASIVPSAADLDAVAAEQVAKAATAPKKNTNPDPLSSEIAAAAPLHTMELPSFRKAVQGGPTNPSYDADKFDSTGKGEKEDPQLGPRGDNQPADVMSADERAAVATKHEARLRAGMSPTHSIDSSGNPKGSFETTPQGHDKHGARLPDKIDYSKPVEPHVAMVGPRGSGVPADTFHKP